MMKQYSDNVNLFWKSIKFTFRVKDHWTLLISIFAKMQILRSWSSFSLFNNSLNFNTLVDV